MTLRAHQNQVFLNGALSMFDALLPKGAPFFELLLQQNQILCEVGAGLVMVLENPERIDESHREISLLEESADTVYAAVTKHLTQTFITPIDREDILHINKAQETAIDMLHGMATKLHIYEFSRVRFPMLQLAVTTRDMTLLIRSMLEGLARKKDSHDSRAFRKLKNECEMLLSVGIMELYDLPNPTPADMLTIMKWSHAYDHMERAINEVMELAEAIEEAVLKNV